MALAGEPSDGPLWELAVGGYGSYNPEYLGSSLSSANLIVLPFPIYHGKFLRVGEDTGRPIWAQLFEHNRFRLNIDTEFSFGSKSMDIPLRQGMPDLDPIFEVGPELEFRLSDYPVDNGNIFLALQARPAFTLSGISPGWQGAAFSPELRFVRNFDRPGHRFKMHITPTFGTSEYAQYLYSVDQAYATADRPAYNGKSGYLGTTVGVSINYPLTDKLDIYLGARYRFLNNASNESSPLFEDNSNQLAIVAFIYRFWASKKRRSSDR